MLSIGMRPKSEDVSESKGFGKGRQQRPSISNTTRRPWTWTAEPHIEPTMTITKTDRSPYSHYIISMTYHQYYYNYYYFILFLHDLCSCYFSHSEISLFNFNLLLYKVNPCICTFQLCNWWRPSWSKCFNTGTRRPTATWMLINAP